MKPSLSLLLLLQISSICPQSRDQDLAVLAPPDQPDFPLALESFNKYKKGRQAFSEIIGSRL